jgi:hypothetical protein
MLIGNPRWLPPQVIVLTQNHMGKIQSMSCGGGHLGFLIGIKNTHLVEDLPMIIPGQFGFNCPSGFREEAF